MRRSPIDTRARAWWLTETFFFGRNNCPALTPARLSRWPRSTSFQGACWRPTIGMPMASCLCSTDAGRNRGSRMQSAEGGVRLIRGRNAWNPMSFVLALYAPPSSFHPIPLFLYWRWGDRKSIHQRPPLFVHKKEKVAGCNENHCWSDFRKKEKRVVTSCASILRRYSSR